jgi:hypothetical protein
MNTQLRFSAIVLTLTLFPGCAYLSKTSPVQYGVDLRVAPGFEAGEGEVTVHPMVAYAFSIAGGVDGEDDRVLHLGGQLRFHPASASTSGSRVWFGGEVAYARRTTSFDFTDVTTATNGWTVAALAGLPIIQGNSGTIHAYAALGLNKYGGTGPYARLGFDLQPAFLKR